MVNALVRPGRQLDLALTQLQYFEDGQPMDMRQLGLVPGLSGAAQGYNTEADVVTQLIDGVDLNTLWDDYQTTLQQYNSARQTLIDLLTYPVSNLIESVPQVSETEFEEASEFGVPRSQRIAPQHLQLAYDFKDYDTATRFTWRFLRDADQRQVDAVHQQVLNADQRLLFRKVMEAIFDNRNRNADIRSQNYTVFSLYNGDGTVPPPYKNRTFPGTHSHYMTTESASFEPDDFMDMYNNVAEHGYGIENGTQFVFLGNKDTVDQVKSWRRGVDTGTGSIPEYDFIPSQNQPAMFMPTNEQLLGDRPPSQWNGLTVAGSYAGVLVIEETYIPEGYTLMFGSGGAGNLQNIVGFREHANPSYRGLRLLPGDRQRYPLVDSYYSRSFGTGIRQRGGAVVMQVTASGVTDYTPPADYTRGAA